MPALMISPPCTGSPLLRSRMALTVASVAVARPVSIITWPAWDAAAVPALLISSSTAADRLRLPLRRLEVMAVLIGIRILRSAAH